jgi:hypothetical protein
LVFSLYFQFLILIKQKIFKENKAIAVGVRVKKVGVFKLQKFYSYCKRWKIEKADNTKKQQLHFTQIY